MQGNLSRRRFLGGCATALALPAFVPGSALGADDTVAPSERIALGLIGCGGHGTGWNLDQIFRNPDSQVIAVCDVDRARCEAAQRKVNEHHGQVLGKSYRGCAAHDDFRDLLARKDVDAVANCTPDHWHVIPAVMAARCGKDVICEKPLTLTVAEGRLLCDTMAQTGRVFQTASENRSIDIYLYMCELVRNGRIGKLKHIDVYLPEGNEERGENFSERDSQPVPEGFNYDMWLGQAPVAPYCPARCHGSFRWNYDYAGGRLTDWGAHLIDLAQWGNDTESTGPVEVHGTCTFPPAGSLFNTPETFSVDYVYANGVTMNVSSGVPGVRFEGTDGWISSIKWRGPLAASRPEILHSQIGPDEVHLYHPSQIVKRTEVSMGGEHRNFLDCVKSRKPCYAPAEIGHRTATIAHIGNIALRLGRKLRWNPEAERFLDDAEADKMLGRPQREPWTLANVDKWIDERA
ncbi:MAG: Gfo/Idh/MocA family oxidoreductase [Pirellulales bacterium]|nr:Gfo/Idh/MocA family oxidoreductase [Pirellulales bacterium]